jgi:serine/threonine protein kinase
LKIGDFGLATDSNFNEIKENVGTPLYQSPEQIEGKPYNERVDIYSLGLILLELTSVFKTQSERRFVLEAVRNSGIIPLSIHNRYPLEYNLIKLMTDRNPEKRPSTHELLNSQAYKSMMGSFDCIETEDL